MNNYWLRESSYCINRRTESPGRRLTEPFHQERKSSAPSQILSVSHQTQYTARDAHNVNESCVDYLSQTFSAFSFDSPPSKESNNSDSKSLKNDLLTTRGDVPQNSQSKTLRKIKVARRKIPSAKHSVHRSFCQRFCSMLNHVFSLAVFTSIVVLLVSMWVTICQYQCLLESHFLMPIHSLKLNLSSCIVGQEFATSEISNYFEGLKEGSNLTLSWWVGPPGVGKTRTMFLTEMAVQHDMAIHRFFNSLLPESFPGISAEAANLINVLHPCKPNLVIIEEFDQNDSPAVNFIETFIRMFKNTRNSFPFVDYPLKAFIILVGSRHSDVILDFYEKHSQSDRQHLPYSELQDSLLQSSHLKKIPIVPTVVPFLPLTTEHFHLCVMEELNLLVHHERCLFTPNDKLDMSLGEASFSVDEIVHAVIEASKFSSNGGPRTSLNGCKQIRNKINYLLPVDFP